VNTLEVLRTKRADMLRIAERHGARSVRVSGSVVRGEATAHSDIDLLVSVAEDPSPWFPVGLIADLEALLGRKVDVVTEDGLYWLLRRRILKEAKPLWKRTRGDRKGLQNSDGRRGAPAATRTSLAFHPTLIMF